VLVEVEPSEHQQQHQEQAPSQLTSAALEEADSGMNGHVHEADASEVRFEPPLAASTPPSRTSALPTSSTGTDTPIVSQASANVQTLPKSNDRRTEIGEVSKPAPSAPTDSETAEKTKKRQSFLVRTLWTLIMIGGFLCALLAIWLRYNPFADIFFVDF
jgi:hypothetical protein